MKTYKSQIAVGRPQHLGGLQWTLSHLTGLTVLFGKNGSGKSLLMRSLRDQDVEGTHYVVPERTGDLGYNPSYLQQQLNADQRRQVTSRNFVTEYRQQVVARIQAYFAARGDTRGETIPGDPSEIESSLSRLLPDFAVSISGTRTPPYRLVRTEGQVEIANIDQLSSGEAQLMTVGLDVITLAAIWDLTGAQTRIMLIDEPDAHIHPDLQVRFADFLVQIGRRYELQIIVATHSTTLLAALGQFAGNEASVIYLKRGSSEFSAERLGLVQRELASCLGGHALMGPLFGVPIVLVEGDDDYRIWSQVPRHHQVSFSVLPTNGDEIFRYQKSLERIFESLRSSNSPPAGIALLDGDKRLPEDNDATPQRQIKFVRLVCREAENLYLTDEVLAIFNLTWEDAAKKIVDESVKFGSKADVLKLASSWDRKQADFKGVIAQVAQILDPKGVLWTIRVASVLGRGRPTGQLAEFLGEPVISSIWP